MMNMLQPVLIELIRNESKIAASGTALNENYVVTTSHVLLEELRRSKNIKLLQKCNGLRSTNEIIDTPLDFNVIFLKNNSNLYKKARLHAYFTCDEINFSCEKYLNNWKGDDHENMDFLNVFFVLKIDDEIFKSNRSNCNDYTSLLTRMDEIFIEAKNNSNYKIGDRVVIRSTPFGERRLINSHVEGVVSNIFGDNNCLILTDCPTTMGSEGGLLYNKKHESGLLKNPIGLVLSSLNWWNGEWLGLTLCLSLTTLFAQFSLKKIGLLNFHNDSQYLNEGIKYGLVQIVCGPNWGTGVLINKKEGIFLTSSHVINSSCPIKVLWNNFKFGAEILYEPDENSTFDLAVLKCEDCDSIKLKNTYIREIKISSNKPKTGDQVVAAGFSIFSADLKISPSVMAGNISQSNDGRIITSCSVFPGSSGGALLDAQGNLVGIIMSNLKSHKTKATFPRISLMVPVFGLKSVLEEYYKDLDKERLKESLNLIKTKLDLQNRHSKL